MRMKKLLSAVALGVATLSLGACATGLDTKVTRFQQAMIPPGATFYVVPKAGIADARFNRYAQQVAAELQSRGYVPAGAPTLADVLVKVDYRIDEGVEMRQDPFYGTPMGWGGWGWSNGWRDPFYDPYWGIYYGRPYSSRWGGFPYYYGWNAPYWSYGPGNGGYEPYSIFKSALNMDIVQRTTNAPLFEGHAQARSSTDNPDVIVPDLIAAMFTGFPGRNGETVRITIPPPPKRG